MTFHHELLRAADSYHRSEDGEQSYRNYPTEARNLNSADAIARAIIEWHKKWGGGSTVRVLPKIGRGLLRNNLTTWLLQTHKDRGGLSAHVLWRADLRKLAPQILYLFESLRVIRVTPAGTPRRIFGPTLAGKTLHFLLPELCMIWDNQEVRLKMKLDGTAWSYLVYLRVQQLLLKRALSSASRELGLPLPKAVHWIMDNHLQRNRVISFDYEEPITKIMDEAMFDRSYPYKSVLPLINETQNRNWG